MRLSLNGRMIVVILSLVSVIIGSTMLVGLIVALIYHESEMIRIFLVLMIVLVGAGFLCVRLFRSGAKIQTIKIREGIITVALCWVFAAAFGTLPYLFAGSHSSFIDAFFESTACITTTGATLIENLADLPNSLLFWRQFTNWLGGLGIVIFAITIIPMLGFGAANLARAETPGQTLEKLQSRMSDTARHVFIIFLALTALEIVLLLLCGVGVYDAVVLSFGCMGNGGFANYHTGMAYVDNIYVEVVIAVFCVMASLSFVSYQLFFRKRIKEFFQEIENKIFLLLLAVFAVLIVIILVASGTYESAGDAIRYGVFQTVSFITTAGYAGTNFDAWPQATHWLLIIAMIIGGCSGSTTGGIKVVRVAVAFALIRRNIYKRIHPNAVVAVKLGDKAISADRVSSIATFMIVYMAVVLISCVVLSFDNFDAETTMGAVFATISNTGLVFGDVIGFTDSFGAFSQFSRAYMSFLMLAGRLELFTIILFFSPAFWHPYR